MAVGLRNAIGKKNKLWTLFLFVLIRFMTRIASVLHKQKNLQPEFVVCILLCLLKHDPNADI